MNIICIKTNYGEPAIAGSRCGNTMVRHSDEDWIYCHGSSKAFDAHPEFCNVFLKKLLRSHNIELQFRPSRSSHKNGKAERKNEIFKRVLEGLSKENTLADAAMIIARTSKTNMFHNNSWMGNFQLVREDSPSIVEVPSSVVPTDLLEDHKQMKAARALNKLIRSHEHDTLPQCTMEKTHLLGYISSLSSKTKQ